MLLPYFKNICLYIICGLFGKNENKWDSHWTWILLGILLYECKLDNWIWIIQETEMKF